MNQIDKDTEDFMNILVERSGGNVRCAFKIASRATVKFYDECQQLKAQIKTEKEKNTGSVHE